MNYDFELPNELIARHPVPERDESRLLLVSPRTDTVADAGIFRNLVDHLTEDDLLVFNDIRVSPMRLLGNRSTGARVEALILDKPDRCFRALIRPLTRLRMGETIHFRGIDGTLVEKEPSGTVLLDFGEISLADLTERAGEMPIPPYLKRPAEASDRDRYQTVYSKGYGAAAAPTAGLHFTQRLFEDLKAKQIKTAFLTLVVGYGTFAPVDPDGETLHEEFYSIPPETKSLVDQYRAKPGRIVAVGTTTVRALESFALTGRAEARTDIFIKPGFRFKLTDAMVTNFHLPGSSLLMLVHAFAGDIIERAYDHAVAERYRFFSYGDAVFITESKL